MSVDIGPFCEVEVNVYIPELVTCHAHVIILLDDDAYLDRGRYI